MTYTEWRDELKDNLLNVSPSERRRVLDYYAEAYADRRDAGYTEREIIAEFGAPYDAAHRILDENTDSARDDYYGDYDNRRDRAEERRFAEEERRRDEERRRREDEERRREDERRRREEERIRRREEERRRREEERQRRDEERRRREDERRRREAAAHKAENYDPYDDERYEDRSERDERGGHKYDDKNSNDGDYTWVFVILCIALFIPLGSVLIGLIGLSIAAFMAPLGITISGAVMIGTGVGEIVGGSWAAGAYTLGSGVIVLGIGVALFAVLPRVAKLMWKLAKKFFNWIKSQFSGKKERA